MTLAQVADRQAAIRQDEAKGFPSWLGKKEAKRKQRQKRQKAKKEAKGKRPKRQEAKG